MCLDNYDLGELQSLLLNGWNLDGRCEIEINSLAKDCGRGLARLGRHDGDHHLDGEMKRENR